VEQLKALMKVLPALCEALGLNAVTSTIHPCLRRKFSAGRLVTIFANYLEGKLELELLINYLTSENVETIQWVPGQH
jgi:hypothetical protein